MRTFALWIGAAAAAYATACLPSAALAQFGSPHFNMHGYEAGSHARWHAERGIYYGETGPIRGALHQARHAVEGVKHSLNHLVGNPDFQHYTRWDRRPLGLFGPYPSGGYMAGYPGGYQGGYGGYPGGCPGVGMPPMYGGGVVMPPAPVYGGPAMNQTGGARYPTTYNPGTGLFW
jgi:hypothetical protein